MRTAAQDLCQERMNDSPKHTQRVDPTSWATTGCLNDDLFGPSIFEFPYRVRSNADPALFREARRRRRSAPNRL